MKSALIATLTFALAFTACTFDVSTEVSNATPKADVEVQFVDELGEEDAVFADIQLTGMACEMACGGSIKRSMKDVKGVIATEIEFDDTEEVDLVRLRIDEDQFDSKTTIAQLNELNEGQFTVKSVQIRTVSAQPVQEEIEEDLEEDEGDVSLIQLPNFFDVFTRLY